MAKMVIKDMIICPKCGAEMFPNMFDRENRKIGYKCKMAACGIEKVCAFEEVKLEEGERFNFVCLNDDGEVTWKCYGHGYCDYPIEALLDMDFTKFERCCCILGRDEEEIGMDVEFAFSAGREKIKMILDAVGEENLEELAAELIIENDIDIFGDDYEEAFVAESICCMDGPEEFIYRMIDTVYELFEISIEE